MEDVFLSFSTAKLRQLEGRIQDCLELLSKEQIWWRASEENNSVGNLVLHLSGNIGQWIVSGVGGVPSSRNRDGEFAARAQQNVAQLRALLAGTVNDAIRTIETSSHGRLTERVMIQCFDVTILEAIYHGVEHFAMHAGQIIYITKSLLKQDLGFHKHVGTPVHIDNTP